MPYLTIETVKFLTNSYGTHTPRLQDTWGGLAGIKIQSKTYVLEPFSMQKLRKAVIFVYEQESGGVLQPKELA